NWQPKESGSVSWTLYSVSYGDSENAWVSSYNGEILHSSDGGETWNQQNSGISTPLHSIFFNNSDTGWTAGNNGIILKTTNSGNNWFQLNTGTTDWLRSIYFINKNTGWAAGSPSTLINTTDGGASWESLSPAGYYSFNAVYFLDEYKGWLVDGSSGSDGNILKTIDGGLNWQIQLNVPATSLMDVYFINADTGWVVGSRGQIWNSTNGGDEWILQDDDIYNGINSIAHSEDNDIWVGGSNEMILFLMRNIPVEINTFKAIIINNFVNLEWSTSTEMNNRGFKLLKKKYGINNYEPEWTEIAFIPGHGTTTEPQHYSFADNAVEPGKYQYKLKQIDYDGTFEYSQIVEVEIPLVDKFSLEQNYPNPFNPSTKIKYSIPEASFVTLKLFGVLGNEIATLVNEEQHAGIHEVEFNAIKNSWFPASGVYLYQLRAGDFISTKKMILLK
ncbi:MAG TPA: YCF48-related protein, partial [Ignavibacteriaceae bacterium]